MSLPLSKYKTYLNFSLLQYFFFKNEEHFVCIITKDKDLPRQKKETILPILKGKYYYMQSLLLSLYF